MTKQASKITTQVANKIATAISAADNTGSIVTQVCDIALKAFKGEAIQPVDQNEIANRVVKERGLKGRNATSRASEIRNVLRAYASLPTAVSALKKHSKFDGCFPWHASIKLARCVNKTSTVKAAVAAYFAPTKASKPKSPLVQLTGFGASIANVTTTTGKPRQLQQALIAVFEKYGVSYE